MLATYFFVRLAAAVGAVALFALFAGAAYALRKLAEGGKSAGKTKISGKPAFSGAR